MSNSSSCDCASGVDRAPQGWPELTLDVSALPAGYQPTPVSELDVERDGVSARPKKESVFVFLRNQK